MRALRSERAAPRAPEGAARVQVISPDAPLSENIAQCLRGWGARVAVESDVGRLDPSAAAAFDVVLLDLRRLDDALLAWLSALKRAEPGVEVILLSLPGQVATSIAAMRAGASSEVSAPFDVATLRAAVSAALRRRRKRLAARRPSLLERFQRAMAAATFAQAGEFETARELLAEEEPPARRGPRGAGP